MQSVGSVGFNVGVKGLNCTYVVGAEPNALPPLPGCLQIEEDTDRDRYMSPLEAKSYGIIDHIVGGEEVSAYAPCLAACVFVQACVSEGQVGVWMVVLTIQVWFRLLASGKGYLAAA